MDTFSIGISAGLSLSSIFILYKLIRPYFPITVTCWFCHEVSSVPYGNKNCWDCPSCDQYNGFAKDGGYNKPIPPQYDEYLNHPVTAQKEPATEFLQPSTSKLCPKCEGNQALKIRRLADFVPINEASFDQEVKAYQLKLERAYRLCFSCESRVNTELRRQDQVLKPKLRNYITWRRSQTNPRKSSEGLDRTGSVVTSLLNMADFALTFIAVGHLAFSLYALPSFHHWRLDKLQAVHSTMRAYAVQLLITALVLQLVKVISSHFLQRLRILDIIVSLIWLLLYAQLVARQRHALPASYTGTTCRSIISFFLSATATYGVLTSGSKPQLSPSSPRCDTPTRSDAHSLLSNGSVDSGLSDSHFVHPELAMDVDVDCTSDVMSGLSIGHRLSASGSMHGGSTVLSRHSAHPSNFSSRESVHSHSAASFRSPGSIYSHHTARRSASHHSPGSVYSHHAARCSASRRSPGSIYSHHTAGHSVPGSVYSHHTVTPHAAGYHDAASYSPPSVSPHRSVVSHPSSPNGSTLYSQAGSYVPLDQRILPQRTPLGTQILLGVSLGINLSIIAFLMGWHSANGGTLSLLSP